jgi:adenosylcobinamide-GDP ribazoletransferase
VNHRFMAAPRGLFDDFAVTTTVLTRLPVGTGTAADGAVAAAGWAFPLVGAGIGALAALAFLVAEFVGCGAPLAALLTLAAGIAVTGALHEDGLADTADGFGGGRTRDDKLQIMRDSRHGTFGILALVLSVGLRTAAITAIGDPIRVALALVATHAVSRGALPPLMRVLPAARSDGLGAAAGRPSAAVALIAVAIAAAIALALLGPARGIAALALTGVSLTLAALLAWRQIGGYTGDVLGFFQQIAEIVMLLVAAAR